MRNVTQRVTSHDPAKRTWNITTGERCVVWCDASSLITGVVIEIDEDIVDDISWVKPKDNRAHINKVELDSWFKKMQHPIISIRCDSASVCKWVESITSGDKRIHAKRISEALVRRRLWLFQQTIQHYKLTIKIILFYQHAT